MSTDKTMADVQPGGRVGLGDQVLSTSEGERRYVADFFATQLRRHDFGDYILTELAGDFACALAQHLSAQPSPGGQDAAIKAMAESLLCAESSATLEDAREQAALLLADALPHLVARQPVAEGYEVWAQNAENVAAELTDERAIKALRFAARGIRCAARQPVGDYEVQTENGPLKCSLAVYAEWQKSEEHIARLEEELKSSRQPVGEIVGWQHCGENHEHMVISDSTKQALKDGETGNGIRKIDAAYSIPLVRQPATPPAQAVDLGPDRFRDPDHLAEWLGSLVDGSEQEEWDAAQAAMIGVRAFQQHPAVIERLREAVDGECDGLAITVEQATAIFDHVLEPSPLIDGKAVGK